MKKVLSVLLFFYLLPINLFAWTNGELLIWMDPGRGRALDPLVQKFETDFGVKVIIETPEKITRTFPMAAQVGKGPDIVIWAHDKVGEWADSGLIEPVEISSEFREKFFPEAWQAVQHHERLWGYPIALETVTLIYNKVLLDGPPPTDLSQLASVSRDIKSKHPGVIPILWDSRSPFYIWGILASDGGYVFAKKGADYDLEKVGVATSGAVDALSKIISLIHSGVLPKSCSYSETEDLMGQGKLAMMISGPWAWSSLIQRGIDFGLGQIPGVNGQVGRPFVGVSVAYLNRSSPNHDLIKEFLEHSLLSEEGLTAMNKAKPIGIPALISLYQEMAKDNPLLQALKVSVDHGQVMPNIPQMGRFFSSLGAALEIAVNGQLAPEAALREAQANMLHR
jgi:maltose/maltodextrin transport system substrate-binding protein